MIVRSQKLKNNYFMQLKALQYLEDIYLACCDIEKYTENKTYADFKNNSMFSSAVERQLTIIGEATNRLSKNCDIHLKSESAIIALRNRIVHEYQRLDDKQIWQIVETQLVDLKIEVEQIIKDNEHNIER